MPPQPNIKWPPDASIGYRRYVAELERARAKAIMGGNPEPPRRKSLDEWAREKGFKPAE